jgi:hypothetical protein
MADSDMVSFRATEAAQHVIDRIVATGLASTRSDAINLALEAAPEGLASKLARDAEALRTKAALLFGTGDVTLTGSFATQNGSVPLLTSAIPSRKTAADMLIETFLRVIKPLGKRPFGSLSLGLIGLSDDNQGVQWNGWVEFEEMSALLSANLEGLRYKNWPCADYILRELKEPQLFDVMDEISSLGEIEMVWWRDAWQSSGRIPRFAEQDIAALHLDSLTKTRYREILREALACLDAAKQHRGRANQTITLKDGRKVDRFVSPHFQFRVRLWSGSPSLEERDALLAAGRDVLRPIYDFMLKRTA